ncbi:cell division protein ZapD [Candidatus Comchoanobacter bicostacola]|uniref:Cell division protein ZapD n=1 Tax=Candidatus Comchoanobacter bicostacola TaxID=2919598 RepID=A0ABY5DLD9_9GAMM|nr:cell division protein ZapD [Candidatus Comchoanobacter bicostacola]UTC24684.1 cell division protein ZapD [Candidatus Comchoanobacter bicostacola]
MTYVYEKAYNETIRLCLLYEQHLKAINQMIGSEHVYGYVFEELSALIQLVDRQDFKTKLVMTFYQFEKQLGMYEHAQAIDDIHDKILLTKHNLSTKTSGVVKGLMTDPLLSRMYYKHQGIESEQVLSMWERQSPVDKAHQVSYWLKAFSYYTEAISLVLYMVRGIGDFKSIYAKSGFYRESCIEKDIISVQLIRIECPNYAVFPVISMAKRWLAVTFHQGDWVGQKFEVKSASSSFSFKLSLCSYSSSVANMK